MLERFYCRTEARRDRVRATVGLNGIDFLEVAPDQKTLIVQFLKPLPGETGGVPASLLLDKNFRIEGGVRVTGITATIKSINHSVLRLSVSTPGDFSAYRLKIVSSVNQEQSLDGFDPVLSSIEFSFKAGCPNPFDCKTDEPCVDEPDEPVDINYLAKDFPSFRRLLMDHMARQVPDWSEPNAAAAITSSIEVFAYAFDRLSYMQDAVGTEAYLATARLRPSVRRHARLLDYFVNEGCNARAWICFEAALAGDGINLEQGTPILALGTNAPSTLPTVDAEKLSSTTLTFELMKDIILNMDRNEIHFYTWSDEDCCLPKGALGASLSPAAGANLAPGDTLVLEEIMDLDAGFPNRENRHAVRLTQVMPITDPVTGTDVVDVTWHPNDALPFALRVSGLDESGSLVQTAVARGNTALADHGRSFTKQDLTPDVVPSASHYRPKLPRSDITFACIPEAVASAAQAIVSNPAEARCSAVPSNTQGEWEALPDLLGSDGFKLGYVAEPSDDRSLSLRFGDDVFGAQPNEGSDFTVDFRVGNGTQGNVGPDRLTTLVHDQAVVSRVWNPLPASGGVDPESLDQVRRYAPQAFRTQQRAVTADDYAKAALRFEIDGQKVLQQAVAEFRWTGSWLTVYLTVDRFAGLSVANDAVFAEGLLAHMDDYRMAGVDIELRDALYVAVDLALLICVKTGFFRTQVQKAALDVLSNRVLANGSKGLFHADNFTFAEHVFVSQIVAPIEALDGVDSVRVTRLQRWGEAAGTELSDGYLKIGDREVARLDNDPNFAENGRIEIDVRGGL